MSDEDNRKNPDKLKGNVPHSIVFDEIIPWEVDTRITNLQAEIDRLRVENAVLFQEGVISNNELARLHDHVRDIENELARQLSWRDEHVECVFDLQKELESLGDYCERLRMELSRHGWGDMHYSNSSTQDPEIVALLAERGTNGSKLVETIDINTEPNVFERDPEPGTERAEIHTTNTQTPIANYKFPWDAD